MAHHAIALYVGKQLTGLSPCQYSEYSFLCMYYFIYFVFITRILYVFTAVILNTLYAFYVLCLVPLHLFVGK